MDVLFELVRRLVLLTIFAAFCELLLPRSSFRSYTRMVVGLLVIAMLLQPILELRGATINLDSLLGVANLRADSEAVQGGEWLQEQSKEIVEAQLAEQVAGFLAAAYPGHDVEVNLDVSFDQYGNVSEFKEMEVVLRAGSQGIEPIKPVSVGGEETPTRQPAEPETTIFLARNLGIPADILSVWIYTGGGVADGQ